ncbi:zinc finger BED domain-containing protein RICESLEEPER 4-like [Beta vulgaris subsp. vulgaris]|uniref:zinc finger BED domain-containing protein RICESLEEPER 4-like n=1 Tax=Beta vulgaris subsp. vulgaris TaxID=3555 RepID=UPI0025492D1F|nr:zinc finger BED domain-containing protein RICESLEEPER 4-like [Beta vulgaris subsp. vulgaris]
MDGVTPKHSDASSTHPNEQPFEVHDLDVEEGNSEGFVEGDKEKEASCDLKSNKKLTSGAWNYFDLVMVNGVKKAKCKNCKKTLSYSGSSGTSHLLKHAKKTCSARHLNLAAGQTQLKIKEESDGSTSLAIKEKQKKVIFDQEVSRRELVRMVVIHEYPLSIVDHMGFRSFVKSLNDNFKMISRNTLKSDVLKMYNNERSSLKDLLENSEGRVAITTDMWTASNQKKGYMAVTSHFIDQNWVLHNRTLR